MKINPLWDATSGSGHSQNLVFQVGPLRSTGTVESTLLTFCRCLAKLVLHWANSAWPSGRSVCGSSVSFTSICRESRDQVRLQKPIICIHLPCCVILSGPLVVSQLDLFHLSRPKTSPLLHAPDPLEPSWRPVGSV